ncbi:hypothetical protein HYN56_12245 [Flavobacterium crocinum]|uniref:DUF5723 domain-containing protein n=1 Tax=Flavobacterium crocinum TaxID=2183896 RepID=A0A2S1YLR9_9FLAO|nr:DUF5723 family protein [Flavobacterium crocinum]AWK04956.1 hypothetical protein HYN56_12245 [Flavobacterium crocinum]
MRKLSLIFFAVFQFSCFAQNKEVLYNFTQIPQSLLVNPGADVSYKYYFGFPVLSGISANVGSKGFTAYDLFADNGVDFNQKVRNVLNNTSRNDKVMTNQQLEIFSGGFRVGGRESRSYVSFGMYQEFDFFMYVPKDPALLALNGNRDYIGKSFNLGDLSARAEVLSVLHIGYHKKINDKFVYGGRAKIYSSGANATSTKNSGYIYTGQNAGTPNVYNQVISSNLELKTSGIAKFTKDEYDGNVARDLVNNTFFGGSLGLGVDAGITYYIKDNLQLTASIIDLGFIRQSKDIETLTYKGTYQYNGVNPDFMGNDDPEDVFDEFEKAIPRDTLYNKYTTWRPTKFYSSIQYSFGEARPDDECNCRGQINKYYKNAVGAQIFAMTTPRQPIAALTAFYRRNIFRKLDVKATYTFDSFSNKNIGLGLAGTIGKVNIYALVNNILEYRDVSKANGVAFQFGINFIVPDSVD